jgi:exopolyphosphatase/pppGpp-phosphohydrolase
VTWLPRSPKPRTCEEIISGEQEAEWGFRGATRSEFAREPLLLLDVGGGGMSSFSGRATRNIFAKLSARRALLEKIPPSVLKPEELAACREWLGKLPPPKSGRADPHSNVS